MKSTKLGILAALYFSQGLPFGFFMQALPVILRQQGFSLGEVGLASLLALPWALKFLWAPLVDRTVASSSARVAPRLGRRARWIVPLQLASIAVLATLALVGSASMPLLMGAVLVLNLVAATQDIASDGLAVDLLAPSERGLANGLQVAGYRVGTVVGGGVLLILHDRLGASATYAAMAALIAVATVPVLRLREPAAPVVERSRPHVHFLRRPGAARVLLLILAYKAGDGFATGMLRPFLADAGLGLDDIGLLLGTVGFIAGLLGALCGGALVNRLGRRTALVAFGTAQAVTVGGYAYLAAGTPSLGELYALCAAEHLAGGMATAALFTCMMDWCGRDTAATDYTVQASAFVVSTGLAQLLAGFSAQAFGYAAHFTLATALAVGAVLAVGCWFPLEAQAAQLRGDP